MKTIEQIIGVHKFETGTSEIGIRSGGIIYIKNNTESLNDIWYLAEQGDIEWIFQHVDKEGKEGATQLNISRVDWLLETLIGTEENTNYTPSTTDAVAHSATARKWVSDLNEAKERVEFWFSIGCPTTKEEQETILLWSNMEDPSSPKDCHIKNQANEILRMQIMIKAQESKLTHEDKKDKGDTRN